MPSVRRKGSQAARRDIFLEDIPQELTTEPGATANREPREAKALPIGNILCPLCGAETFTRLFVQRDLALGVPGLFALARCNNCGLLYQNPRVRVDQLSRIYPPSYAAHTRDPELSRTLRRLGPAVRLVLAKRLGYRHLRTPDVRWKDQIRGVLFRRRILKAFPRWIGRGRLLDVGCGSGKFLRQMAAVGWEPAGVEFDREAAVKAKQVTPNVFVGDPTEALFPGGSPREG